MNETAKKQRSAVCPEIRQSHRTNIPVEVYTCGAVSAITEVTARSKMRDGWKQSAASLLLDS